MFILQRFGIYLPYTADRQFDTRLQVSTLTSAKLAAKKRRMTIDTGKGGTTMYEMFG
jgi:hypothetical protein